LPIHALYPSRRFVSSKIRAFIDFLAEEFRNDPLIAVDDHSAT
jgi:DNA-binding transcriptional LysR family regulator